MKRFIEGVERGQGTLIRERLEDWIGGDNPVRAIDVLVDERDLGGLGFDRAEPLATGRPAYHPADMLKLYIYGYLNRVQSSRRLEQEAGRRRCHVSRHLASLWAATPEIMQRSSLAATVSSRRRGIGGVFGGRPDGVGR